VLLTTRAGVLFADMFDDFDFGGDDVELFV